MYNALSGGLGSRKWRRFLPAGLHQNRITELKYTFFTDISKVFLCPVLLSKKIIGTQCTPLASGAAQNFQLSEKRGDIRVEDEVTSSRILLPVLDACCCGPHKQQYTMLVCVLEDCISKMSNTQYTLGCTGISRSAFAAQLLEELHSLREAAH